MPDTVISVNGLVHRYGVTEAVRNISFGIAEGEIFSFLGPNGAGKSTVINILTTLLPVQEGYATIAGFDVMLNPAEVRRRIGIVFQEVTLDRDMTVSETLAFHGMLYNMPREVMKSRIQELIGIVELSGKRDTLTKHLSGGMKRRLEIARGLMTRPRVLFLDEPTIGLDPQTRMRIWDYIRQINREGTTIFLTTHYMDEADQLSDRIGIIDHGRIITAGKPIDLKNALGQDVIYLETTDNAAAIRMGATQNAIISSEQKKNGVLFTVSEDGTRILPRIIDLLRNNGIGVLTINMKKPSMDDVFVHHTGREIRDAGPDRLPGLKAGTGRR